MLFTEIFNKIESESIHICGSWSDFGTSIAYALNYTLSAHADISSGYAILNYGFGLHLHPYFVYASSDGSGESAHLRRHA